jgi:hypothetical protein
MHGATIKVKMLKTVCRQAYNEPDTTVRQLWMLYIKVNLGARGKERPLIDKTYTLNYNGPTQLQFHFVFHTQIKLSLSLQGMRIFKNKLLKIISGPYRR